MKMDNWNIVDHILMIRETAKFRVYLDKLELCPKNLSSTNSFGEYKTYDHNGELSSINSYIDDKKVE